MSPAIWDDTVLLATRHKWTRPALTPARRRVLDLPGGMEGWIYDLGYPAKGTAGSRTRDLSITSPTPQPLHHWAYSIHVTCSKHFHKNLIIFSEVKRTDWQLAYSCFGWKSMGHMKMFFSQPIKNRHSCCKRCVRFSCRPALTANVDKIITCFQRRLPWPSLFDEWVNTRPSNVTSHERLLLRDDLYRKTSVCMSAPMVCQLRWICIIGLKSQKNYCNSCNIFCLLHQPGVRRYCDHAVAYRGGG